MLRPVLRTALRAALLGALVACGGSGSATGLDGGGNGNGVDSGDGTDTPAVASAQLGPRPYFLVDRMRDDTLKATLAACADGPFHRTRFAIGHRGAALQFPEHTRESYLAGARMGAGILECDVTFTADRELVCRHSQCDLHTTTDILTIPDLAAKCSTPFTPARFDATGNRQSAASARCCTSDITLADFRRLSGKMDGGNPDARTVAEYLAGTPSWRTDLYAGGGGQLQTLDEAIALFRELGVGITPELKVPDVPMPFDGDFTQATYAEALVDALRAGGIAPGDTWLQSFSLADIDTWNAIAPDFAGQAIYLDDRYTVAGFSPDEPASWSPDMAALAARGVNIIAPPLWVLLSVDASGELVPSAYARAAREAGLSIVTWTLERSGPLSPLPGQVTPPSGTGGGFYFQGLGAAMRDDGDVYRVLDALAMDVGVIGVFSDWPATVTYYANCLGLD